MGAHLFDAFPNLEEQADARLGYSIRRLCVEDPDGLLGRTEFCQPAMYVVCVMEFLMAVRHEPRPDFLAGHSLGEYAALFASGVFDFETGLDIVKARAARMAAAGQGAMLAVIGLDRDDLRELLVELALDDVDIANHNLFDQTVLAGPKPSIDRLDEAVLQREGIRTVHLHVGGAFHSRYARDAGEAFRGDLKGFPLRDPRRPLVSSVTARLVAPGEIRTILESQIVTPVDWLGVMRFLRTQGVTEARQIGPGRVLDGLWEGFSLGERLSSAARTAL